MGAFFSSTDNRDDQNNIGFSGVVGRLKDAIPQTVWRFNYRDRKVDCDLDDIFAMPARPAVEAPEEWLEKVNTPTYAPPAPFNGGNSQKGKADHLKQWQFRKGGAGAGAGEGNREGPHMRAHRRSLHDGSDRSEALDWQGDFWGFDRSVMHPDDSFHTDLASGGDERFTAAERALSYLREDPEYNVALPFEKGNPHYEEQGEYRYNPLFDPDVVNQHTGEILDRRYIAEDFEVDPVGIATYEGDDRYDDARSNYGHEAAEAFCLIDDVMTHLDGKDELIETLMADMIHMASPDFKETLFKRIYQELPDEVQESIQTNGIH